MIPPLKQLFSESPEISRFVNLQMQRDVTSRLLVVLDYLNRANILLDLLLQANDGCNGETFRIALPQMSALAQGVVDHMHIASNITTSLLGLSAYDLEYPSGKKLSGPHRLKDLNPNMWASMKAACTALEAASKELKGIRDTAHHVDERLNGKAKMKEMTSSEAINIGCFARGQTLVMQSTAVLYNSPLETPTNIPTYIAQVELSQTALKNFAEQIGQVFATFPWDGQLPLPLLPQ